jgi:hypothetical protein
VLVRPIPRNPYYQPPDGADPARPWWKAVQQPDTREHCGHRWERRDEWCLYDNGYRWYSSPPVDLDGSAAASEGQSYEEVMALVDANWPLPPPPLRAGQVWLLCARQSWITALLNTTLDSFLRPGPLQHTNSPILPLGCGVEAFDKSTERRSKAIDDKAGMLPGVDPLNMGGWLLGDQFFDEHDAEGLLLGDHPDIKAFLIADPVDPSVVPWTGAKGEGDW